jgi:hypothetical protein
MEFYNELKQLLANTQQAGTYLLLLLILTNLDSTIRKAAEAEIKRLRDNDPVRNKKLVD